MAELEVSGAAGIEMDVSAASAIGTARQLDRSLPIPIDFSVPVGHVLGLPFTLSARQEIEIKTAFSARNGNIKAKASNSIGGTVAFGYRGGQWGTRTPPPPTVQTSLLDSIKGVSVGVNGIVVASTTTFTLGIGAFGFTTGLNLGFVVSTGMTVGASLDRMAPLWNVDGTAIKCRGANLNIDATYQVGYTLPSVVVKVINFLMKPFGIKPVPRTGGIPSPPGRAHVYRADQYEPAGCRPG